MFTLIKLVFLLVCIILLPFWFFTFQAYATALPTSEASPDVVLVLGAGVANGQPSRILQLRLDKAYELYTTKAIRLIFVSGDDQDIYYNEPLVMKKYLVTKVNLILGGIFFPLPTAASTS